MTPESLARELDGRKCGATWMGKCPAHEDHNPSLAITEKDGLVLVHCHAGCPQGAVIDALKELGVWETDERAGPPVMVAEYNYTDKRGGLLYQVVRYLPKAFRQRRPDGYGGWIWKKADHQVLYRLPEVSEAAIVFVVEGEKDAETLRTHGFVGTTNAGGAKAPWLPSFTQTLAGREAIVIPDADTPGRIRAAKIARALIGHAAKIVLLELEGAKDVTDWFNHGHSEVELISLAHPESVNQ